MARTVQLDENKHAIALMRDLKQLQHTREHCDFIIKVGDLKCPAHKNILTVNSRFFKAVLQPGTKESQNGAVELKDADYECVKSCINFMYTACFDIPEGKAGDLLHAATIMQLDDMIEAICSPLRKSYLLEIMESKKISEEVKLSISLTWVGSNPERKENVLELIKLVKLKEISSGYLSDILKNHPVISNDIQLYKLVSAPLVESATMQPTAEKLSTHEQCDDKTQIVFCDGVTRSLRSYDTVTSKVTKLQNISFYHLWPWTVTSMDSYIYLLCERRSVYRFNFRNMTSKWERMQDMIADHGPFPPTVAFFGSLFVVGGSTSDYDVGRSNHVKNVEKFDPDVSQSWSKIKDKPKAIYDAALVSLDENIYCIGGYDGDSCIKAMSRFTPSASEWIDLKPMVISRRNCAAAAIRPKIYVIGGVNGNKKTSDIVECYDVSTEQWTRSTQLLGFHRRFDAHHVDGWIFIVDQDRSLKEAEKYDIKNDKWHRLELRGIDWKHRHVIFAVSFVFAIIAILYSLSYRHGNVVDEM